MNSILFPEINDYYKIWVDQKEYYAGNLIIQVTAKGLLMNKVLNKSITQRKTEKYLKNKTSKKTNLVRQILGVFD